MCTTHTHTRARSRELLHTVFDLCVLTLVNLKINNNKNSDKWFINFEILIFNVCPSCAVPENKK